MTDVYVGSGDTAPSDAELILGVRGGDLEAYGALYERHAAAARRLAREYTRSGADAEDVVAEAFDRVLRVLQHGGGPDLTFRAYLFTVVRRLAGDLAGRARRTRPTADDGTFEAALGAVASSEDPTLVDFERSIVARAYLSLPERWQAVLWYTEVENLTPAEIAPMLGLSANGVSALAFRAREGLRVGYLQQHLTQDPADGCQAVNPHLGAFVRGGLARREATKVEEHLEGCGKCRTLVLELGDVAHGMRAVIAPLVLGIAGLAALGSLPLGGPLVGAAAVGTAATAGSAAGTAAAGTTAAGSAVVGASATVGAGGAAAVGAGGSAATAVTGTAVVTGAAATGAVAAGATVASGVSLAVAAGAIAVATVGMVNALNGMHTTAPSGDPTAQVVAPLTAAGTNEIEKLADAASPDAPDAQDAQDAQDAASPANVLPALPPEIAPPAELALAVADRQVLLDPRVAETVRFTVTNGGGHAAEEAFVRFDLPKHLVHASAVSPQGVSVTARRLSSEALPCTPAGETARRVVLCSLDTLEPGESRTVAVTVVARHGGEHKIHATAWSEEVRPTPVPLTAAVRYFGPELTAHTGERTFVENPGEAVVPLTIQNSGDRPAEQWSVDVVVPAGLAPVGTGGLTCEPGRTGWTCSLPAGAALEPGEVWAAHLRVVADGETPDGGTSAAVVPQLPGSDHVVQAEASFDVDVAWDDVPVGVGPLQAVCAATGGLGAADTVVEATYTNALPRPVTVRLAAAGATSQAYALEPGESRTVDLHDGLRVPAGGATWTVTTVVAGTPYSTTVAAGTHGAKDCYDPAWDVTMSVTTVNAGGVVRIDGTATNDSPEPLQVGMLAAGGSAAPVRLGPGESAVLSVATGATAVAAGEASFGLYRWVTDSDGDEPARGLSVDGPAATYAAATIAPRVEASAARGVRDCRYDAAADASRRTFDVALDNTASTLPVTFAITVAGVEHTTKVPAGEVGSLTAVDMPWGTEQLEVRADGRAIGLVDVGFESCAEVAWPASTVAVTISTQCVADSAHVVADVVNKGSSAWVATLVRGGRTGEPVTVQPGTAGRVLLDLHTMTAPPGTVKVRLERTHEGLAQTVEDTLQHDGTSCVVVAPQTRIVEGAVEVTGDWWGDRTSTRTADVVLDNSDSNVPVDFRVVGPGVNRTVTVEARTTETLDVGVVQGRDGATFRAAAGGQIVDLVVEQFTGMTAWCEPDASAGDAALGELASWQGVNYRFVGVPDVPTAGGSAATAAAGAPGQQKAGGQQKATGQKAAAPQKATGQKAAGAVQPAAPTGPGKDQGQGQGLTDAPGQARLGKGKAVSVATALPWAAPGGRSAGWEPVSECEYR